MLHINIHQMYQQNIKVAQIATALKVSRPTVYKYLKMTYEDALHEFDGKGCSRKKKLDAYRDWIIAWLEEYPHLSSAQVHDWLLERYPDLSVGSSTVRTYVKEIREVYQIEKKRKESSPITRRSLNNRWASRYRWTGVRPDNGLKTGKR